MLLPAFTERVVGLRTQATTVRHYGNGIQAAPRGAGRCATAWSSHGPSHAAMRQIHVSKWQSTQTPTSTHFLLAALTSGSIMYCADVVCQKLQVGRLWGGHKLMLAFICSKQLAKGCGIRVHTWTHACKFPHIHAGPTSMPCVSAQARNVPDHKVDWARATRFGVVGLTLHGPL